MSKEQREQKDREKESVRVEGRIKEEGEEERRGIRET